MIDLLKFQLEITSIEPPDSLKFEAFIPVIYPLKKKLRKFKTSEV